MPRAYHLDAIREMTKSGLVDIMLMSASTAERLSEEGLFKKSKVTPAIRLNDTTDIWSGRGGRYREEPSRYHRTARVDQAKDYVDLGLYSVTFSNKVDIDAANSEAYFGVPQGRGASTASATSSKSSIRPSTSNSPTSTRSAASSTTTSSARSPA